MKQILLLRKFFFLFSLPVLLVACSKKDSVVPPVNQSTASPISYNDANISVSGFMAKQVSAQAITVSFSLNYQKSVAKLEIMSGVSQNQLCSIYVSNINDGSLKNTNYSITDTNIKGQVMFYMIKYTLTDGNWGYTPVYKLQVQ